MDCIKIILEKGEVQLTAAERKEMVDKKRNEIGRSNASQIEKLSNLFYIL